jgi:hypothetical protein
MKAFRCGCCETSLHFEDNSCKGCGRTVGFLSETLELVPFENESNGARGVVKPNGLSTTYRPCANGLRHGVCNWMIPTSDSNIYCEACRLNAVIPDLQVSGNLERWGRIEAAKRRWLYTVFRLGIPSDGAPAAAGQQISFRFLGDAPGEPSVVTGHDHGVITLNIAEADDEVRERRRVELHEPYRSLLGHFRHEGAHYYWFRLIADSSWLVPFREQFGDERADYQVALEEHQRNGSRGDWASQYISAYASAHPWEDWAETMAHYFHIVDAVETAAEHGIRFSTSDLAKRTSHRDGSRGAGCSDCDELLQSWHPLAFALNALNRSMGLLDPYPFVLSETAMNKLRFVHRVLDQARQTPSHSLPETPSQDHKSSDEMNHRAVAAEPEPASISGDV